MLEMENGIATSTSLVSLPELFSQTILAIFDCIHAAKGVFTQMEGFEKFSNYMENITLILKELSKSNVDDSESLRSVLDILNVEVQVVKQLALECGTRNKVYLLISCRKILKQLESSTKEICQALSPITLASLDDLRIGNKISRLCKDMQEAEYSPSTVEDNILQKIEFGIRESNVDSCYANDLFVSIAEAINVPDERLAIKKEMENFKTEMQDSKLGIDMAEARRMEEVVALLEKADAMTSYEEKEKRYLYGQNSLGTQPLEPLHSFYCPITMDVMVDPVEISSGRTFERSAIERWFVDGNKTCPVTLIHLDTLVLWPNKTLQRSIEEWNDRNKMTTIVSIKSKLQSDEEQEVLLQSLCELQDLCTERELHREWIIFEGYIPILIGLLSAKNREIRMYALAILCNLAKDSHNNKEKIAQVDHALESIVRSLARQIQESKLALQLLLQLSRSVVVRDFIGNIQGCIFLVVTMLHSDDAQASQGSRELLDNLSFLDQNVIQMAKANFFKPLLQLLSSGPDNVRLLMAKTLSEVELTDHHKLSLFKDGALGPLLQLLSHDSLEMKSVGVRALQNLSNLPQNGLQMIKEGALGPLFEILYRHSLSSPSLREQVAVIILHLAKSTNSQEADHEQISLLESDEDIFKLFCLISLTGPNIQRNILEAFYAMCRSSSGPDIRAKLRQLSVVQVLVQFCEVNNHVVRASAVKLFYCLIVDGDDISFQEHVGQGCIDKLLNIIKTPSDEEEAAAAMGIISNLPKDIQITQWLLDSGALNVIFASMNDGNRNALHKKQEIENAVRALCRFTVSTNREWQKKAAEAGFIPVLVQLLVSGTSLTKQNAAVSLKQFSESSTTLSQPVKKKRAFFCCLAAAETGCPIHQGICTVESSFCILEANAVEPLVKTIGEEDFGACEASLDALLTLIEDERLQNGCKVLAQVNAIPPIIKLLSSTSINLQKKALGALGRIFRLPEMKQKYAAQVQMPLVDITQRGSGEMKSLAARVLAQLNILGEQSSYF